MTASCLKIWRIMVICGIIWGSAIMAAEAESRYCYDCVYQKATRSWGPCRGPIAPAGLAATAVDAPLCPTNCFTKIDRNGDIRRGCYDGTYEIDQSLLGCHVQGAQESLYCFCNTDRCNARAPPTYLGQTNTTSQVRTRKKPAVIVNPTTDQPLPKPYRPTPHMVSTHSDKAPNYYTPRTFSRDHNNQNRPSPAREPQGKNKYDVVYGVAKTPQVYQGNNERGQNYNLYPIPGEDIVSQRRRDYENKNVDKYEHNVNVQTVQENKDAKGNIHTHKHPGGRGSVHKKDQRESSREFVDHVQRQRELKTTHQVGRELEQISKVLPTAVVEEPHVEHKETQHFHKYNVGERTIEHHIVEHYVLHHRIKELLRNQHGLDVHNVDPRQASLIYRLLHPHKVAELDAQMPDTFITENEPTRR